jgi:phosphoribosylanthranilate isomerase
MFVKICGITSEDDALLAVAMGADAVGFVFAPSVRQIAPTRAADIAKRLPADIMTVGVFRDESAERVIETMARSGLRAAQLHGGESPEVTARVKAGVPLVIKGFTAGSSALDTARQHEADFFLIDAATPGSGQVFDWSLAENAPRSKPLIMAGGLTPLNVAEAIAKVRPWGVDVASGVEKEPGKKDPRKVRAFVANAKSAEPADYVSAYQEPYDWQIDD